MSTLELPQRMCATYSKVVPCKSLGDRTFDSMLPFVECFTYSAAAGPGPDMIPNFSVNMLYPFSGDVSRVVCEYVLSLPELNPVAVNCKVSLIGQKLKISTVDLGSYNSYGFHITIDKDNNWSSSNNGPVIFDGCYACVAGKDVVYELPDIIGFDLSHDLGECLAFKYTPYYMQNSKSGEASEGGDDSGELRDVVSPTTYFVYTAYVRVEVVSSRS